MSDLTLRARLTYLAHLFKASFKQHHRELKPLFSQLIAKDAVVLDVGGHAGQFAKILAGIASEGHVYSFEPGGYACSILRKSLAMNRLSNTTIFQEALGEAVGEIKLNVPIKKNGVVKYGLSHMGETDEFPNMISEIVRINTIDEFAKKHDIKRLDFIKADIEGWEQKMIMGGAATIRKHMPILYIEMIDYRLASAGDTLEGLWDLLLSWGYCPHQHPNDGTTKLIQLDGPINDDIFWIPKS